MRYRFVLQLDVSPDDDLDCLTADEVRTTEVVVVSDERAEASLSALFDSVAAHIEERLKASGAPPERAA